MQAPVQELISGCSTELGPVETWPIALRAALATCLASPAPMQLWCGAHQVLFYNDAAVPLLGDLHPSALGRHAPDVWGERWSTLRAGVGVTLMPITGDSGETIATVCAHPPRAAMTELGHELRNPLSVLTTVVDTLMLTSPSPETEMLSRVVGELSRTVDEMFGTRRTTAAPPEIAPAQRASRKLLLVEDHDAAARSLKTALEKLGYIVALAHDAPVALSLADSFAPDIVLVDIGLPVVDGWELARRLRERGTGRHFIAVTARGDEADVRRSLDLGFVDHIVKPVDLARLRGVVDKIPPE